MKYHSYTKDTEFLAFIDEWIDGKEISAETGVGLFVMADFDPDVAQKMWEEIVNYTGYSPCPCRDCFETNLDNKLCDGCESAGCEPYADAECSGDHSYGGSEYSEVAQ